MTEERSSSNLGVDVVAERFADAEAALEQVRSHLESLGESAELSASSSKSLTEAADSLREFVTGTTERVAELQSAQSSLKDLLEAAREVIDGSRLEAISAEIKDSTATLAGRVDQIETDLGVVRSEMNTGLQQAESDRAETMRAIAQLDQQSKRSLLLRFFTFR